MISVEHYREEGRVATARRNRRRGDLGTMASHQAVQAAVCVPDTDAPTIYCGHGLASDCPAQYSKV